MSEGESWAPIVGPMREGESRFRELPILTRCCECSAPITPLEMWSVALDDGSVRRGLCRACASDVASGQP